MTDDDSGSKLNPTVNRRRVLRDVGVAGTMAGLAGCNEDLVASTATTTLGTDTPEPVGGGVSDARGSDVDRGRQQLYFAEAGTGSIVRYDLVRSVVSTVASGTDTIQGTWSYDFDAGRGGEPDDDAPEETEDVWWEIVDQDAGERYVVPQNTAEVALVGDVSFADVEPETLPDYDYGTDRISGSDGDNDLAAGTVFAVRTSLGNYAKVEVTSHGYDLDVRYETYELSSPFTRVGTGYDQPEDVVLYDGGDEAYVVDGTSAGGEVRAVKRSNMDEPGAANVASGLPAAGQLAVDESSNVGYVAAGSELVRVDLDAGSATTVYSGLNGARGAAVDASGEFVYVTEAGSGGSGALSRIEVALGRREELATGLDSPAHLAWTSASEDSLLVAERAPGNRVSIVDLPEGTVRRVVDDAARNPTSVSLASSSHGFICSEQLLSEFDLTGGLFASAGPRFVGIGHVPVGHISQSSDVPTDQAGYATTPSDFPHHVTDAPFGGTLSLMLNHHDAYVADGARYYRVLVDGDKRTRTWTALRWSPGTGRQEAVDVPPEGDGYYPVRQPGALWFRPRLGYKLPTGGLSNGLHTITVEFYSSRSASSKLGERSVEVRIDNDRPTARLGRILHRLSDGSDEVVDACAIVDAATDRFKFEVTATDAQQHLRHWRLRALWGDNQSATVAQQGYTDPNGNRKWEGPRNEVRPAGSYWQAQSRRCAHTFYLKAWSRTTNGYHYVHRDAYHKSITLLLP